MSNLAQAIDNNTFTENGAEAFKSSLNANLDLFFKIGASRGRDLKNDFAKAYQEDAACATRILLWARDARQGAGERQQFRDLLGFLINRDPDFALRVMSKVPELGRWDDLFAYMGTPLEDRAAKMWVQAIADGNGLAAKWAPRKDKKGARPLRRAAGLNEATWRKLVVRNTNVVEQKMCANEWDQIDYEKVPSLASARYQKAFERHDVEGYTQFVKDLETGEATINAGAVYPYDVIKSLQSGNEKVANAQWNALPNYLEGSTEKFMPLVDTSGSMGQVVSGSTRALDVAVSLGMYLAERNVSVFKNEFITFSAQPKMQKLKGDTLKNRYKSMCQAGWDMNTDLEAALTLILDTALKHKLPESDMPTKLLVLSDMQFDSWSVRGRAAFGMVESKYAAAGYKMPQVVWWNLADRGGNIPVTVADNGTALVSGFSPSIMTSLLGGDLEPIKIMMETVGKARYDF